MPINFELSSNPAIPVLGAFEIHEGVTEQLITLTRNGLLREGDSIPFVPGVDQAQKPYVLQTVNEFGTPTCELCTGILENFQIEHPDIPVYSLTKQTIEELAANPEVSPDITHQRIQIDSPTATDLGVELEPGQDADTEFWPGALRRAVMVVSTSGEIVHIQQPDDQNEMPDFHKVFEAALEASSQSQS